METNDKNTISTCRKSYLFFQDVDPEDGVEVDVKTDVVCVCVVVAEHVVVAWRW